MEFLYRLYSNDYFGIGLFIVITILAFSFLIILFFGKKDEKARNKENENSLNNDIENQNNISTEELQTESLETMALPVEETPVLTPVEEKMLDSEEIQIDPFVSSNMVLNTDLITNEPKEEITTEPVEKEQESNITENVFEAPSFEESLNFELNIPEESVVKPEQEEFDIEPFNIETPSVETPVIEEPIQNDIFSKPKEDVPKKVVMPAQFSSVYLTKEKEEVKPEVSEEKQEEIAPIPLKPDFDLPKPFDLPKLNKESGVSSASNDNIIKPLTINETSENLNNIFESIEEDSYTINK